MTFFKTILTFLILAQCIVVPLFLKYSWPKKTWTSFKLKIVASLIFVCVGLLSIQISGNTGTYANYIMCGLVCGAIGDAFLHVVTTKKVWFYIGATLFFIGHIFYINAFHSAILAQFPEREMFNFTEIMIVVMLMFFPAIYVLAKIPQLRKLFIPLAAYAAIITFMVVKAFSYFISDWMIWERESYLLLFLTVVLGAILFISSDITLVILSFESQKSNRKLKLYNIVSYFTAQFLLGTSIFLVQVA